MKRFIIAFGVFFLATALSSLAQIQVSSNGNSTIEGNLNVQNSAKIDEHIGVGTSPNSNNQLRVISQGADVGILGKNTNSSYPDSYGIKGVADDNYENYGVHGKAGNDGYVNFGVYGKASGGGYANYGIYGTASGSSNNTWAGYFKGDVYTTGNYNPSDQRFKKNIRSFKGSEALAKLIKLSPIHYEFLDNEELAAREMPRLNAKNGKRIGLLAQGVQTVFPEIVTDVVHVLDNEGQRSAKARPDTVITKAINYQELTVLLLVAIQEQQKRIDKLEKAIRGRNNK